MTMMIQRTSASVVAMVQAGPATTVPGGAPGASLLPPPQIEGDPTAALYALFSKDRQLGLKQQTKDLRQAQQLKKKEWARAKAALAKALKARKKGGFFAKLARKCGKIAKYAAVVAAIGLAIGSGGAGTPVLVLAIAGATMSTAALVQSEAHVLEKLGVDEGLAGKIGTGLTIGGALCSVGAGGAMALGAGSQTTATSLQVAGRNVGYVAGGIQGATMGVSGYATWQQTKAEGEAGQLFADAVAARAAEARLERMMLQIMSDLEASEKADQRTLGHLRGAIEARDTAISMSAMKV